MSFFTGHEPKCDSLHGETRVWLFGPIPGSNDEVSTPPSEKKNKTDEGVIAPLMKSEQTLGNFGSVARH